MNRNEPILQAAPRLLVRRTLKIPDLSDKEAVQRVVETLGALEAVELVDINVVRGQLQVTYDAQKMEFPALAETLKQAGYPLAKGLWQWVKGGWYAYIDATAKANARAHCAGGACCSNPSEIYARRHR